MILSKIKKMNSLVQTASSYQLDFNELCKLISAELDMTCAVVSKNGKLLGFAPNGLDIYSLNMNDLGLLEKGVVSKLFEYDETATGISDIEIVRLDNSLTPRYTYTVVPIIGTGERLATFVVLSESFDLKEDELVICEHAATLIAMEMIQISKERLAEEIRRKSAVQMAINTLSYSEQEAVEHIFDELTGDEGLLVASKIADRVGITRSVIVNALRKFESAGIIESRSLGMKGTYIRVLNEKLFDELEKKKAR